MTPSSYDQLAAPSTPRPSSAALESALTRASLEEGWGSGPIVINRRKPLIHQSFFSTDVVSCSDVDGREFRILCKYGDAFEGQNVDLHRAHGHRGGVAYESMVYRQILPASRATTPAFYGSHRSENGGTWLFVEHLDGASRLTELAGDQVAILARTGEWLGRFHSEWELGPPEAGSDLVKYTRGYMTGWVERTVSFAEDLAGQYPWIGQLRPALAQWAIDIANRPQTVIHGEFYPQNIPVSKGEVVPIDWESTAVGPAEADFAALTEGWPKDAVDACVAGYQVACGRRIGDDFASRIESARLYWDLRWLGDRPEWTVHKSLLPRLERVRERAVSLGYLR